MSCSSLPLNVPPLGDEFRRNNADWANLKVEAQSIPNLSVKVSEGGFWLNEECYVEVSGGNSASIIPPASLARITLISATKTGAIGTQNGVTASSPSIPNNPADRYPLAAIFMQSTDTTITEDMVLDLRPTMTGELGRRTGTSAIAISDVDGLASALNLKANVVDVNNSLAGKADTDGTPSPTFTLNANHTGVPTENGRLEMERGAQSNVYIQWNEVTDQWEFTNDGTVVHDLTHSYDLAVNVPISVSAGQVAAVFPVTRELVILSQSSVGGAFATTGTGGGTGTLNINHLASAAAVGSTIGTIFFSSAANVGTVSVASDVSVSAGQFIQVLTASPLDASLDGVTFNIEGRF